MTHLEQYNDDIFDFESTEATVLKPHKIYPLAIRGTIYLSRTDTREYTRDSNDVVHPRQGKEY